MREEHLALQQFTVEAPEMDAPGDEFYWGCTKVTGGPGIVDYYITE